MTTAPPSHPSKKKKLLIPIIGVAAVLMLAGAAFIGVGSYNARTDQLCSDATAATGTANQNVTTASRAASAAQASAKDTAGYADSKNAEALFKSLSEDLKKISNDDTGIECSSRDAAASLVATANSNTEIATAVTASSTKLTADVKVFQEAETERLAAEKKAA